MDSDLLQLSCWEGDAVKQSVGLRERVRKALLEEPSAQRALSVFVQLTEAIQRIWYSDGQQNSFAGYASDEPTVDEWLGAISLSVVRLKGNPTMLEEATNALCHALRAYVAKESCLRAFPLYLLERSVTYLKSAGAPVAPAETLLKDALAVSRYRDYAKTEPYSSESLA